VQARESSLVVDSALHPFAAGMSLSAVITHPPPINVSVAISTARSTATTRCGLPFNGFSLVRVVAESFAWLSPSHTIGAQALAIKAACHAYTTVP
jgi:hypothetical protein